MVGESCAPSPQLEGSFGQGKGLVAPPGACRAPRARSQLPPSAFRGRKVKEEKPSLFPDPGRRCLPWAPACPGPGHPPPKSPLKRAATSPGPCPASPSSPPRLPRNSLITQTGSRSGSNLCSLNSAGWGDTAGCSMGTPGSCPRDTPWDLGEKWGAVLGCTGTGGCLGSSGVPALGDGRTQGHCDVS